MKRMRKVSGLGGAVLACVFCGLTAARGGTVTWTGATDSLWSTGTNWDNATGPATTDDVVFDGAVDCTVDFVGITTVGNITLAATYTGTVTQYFDAAPNPDDRADVHCGILTLNGGTWFTDGCEIEVSGPDNTAAMLIITGGTLDLGGVSGTLVYASRSTPRRWAAPSSPTGLPPTWRRRSSSR